MITIFLLVVLLVTVLAWFVSSWKAIGPAQVGILLFFGNPEKKVYKSGPVFVPMVPFKWSGIHLWELIRIPTKMMAYCYEGKEEHNVWTSDQQNLVVEITGYVRFPYLEADSLILMIRSGVPLTQEALQEWMEEEVISGLKEIMTGYTLNQALNKATLVEINQKAQEFFLREDGLFAKSGICGNDLKSFTPGTGEVILRIEQINPTEEMQEAMQAPLLAEYKANAAQHTARQASEEVGMQILGTVAVTHGMEIVDLKQDLKDHPEKRGLSVKKGGYAESFAYASDQTRRDRADSLTDIRVGSTEGKALKGDMGSGIAFAGALAGLFGRGGSKNKGNRDNRDNSAKGGRNSANNADEELDAEIRADIKKEE